MQKLIVNYKVSMTRFTLRRTEKSQWFEKNLLDILDCHYRKMSIKFSAYPARHNI